MITDPDEIQEYVRQMSADTTQLQRLINDLLELSRLQNTDFKIYKTELNLTDIIKEAIRSLRQIAQQKQVEIQLKCGVILSVAFTRYCDIMAFSNLSGNGKPQAAAAFVLFRTSFVKPVKHMKNVFRQNPCSAVSYRNLILFLSLADFNRHPAAGR